MSTKIRLFYSLLIIILAGAALSSCSKDSEGLSKVLTYPTFEMEGDQYITINVGSSYTDPGVTAWSGETELDVTVTGSVDTSVPNYYTITYSTEITGEISMSASTNRYVHVIVPGDPYIGEYYHATAAGAPHATRTKTMEIRFNGGANKYRASDMGNQGSPIPVTFIVTGGVLTADPVIQSCTYGGWSLNGEFTIIDGFVKFPFKFVEGGNTGTALTGYWKKK